MLVSQVTNLEIWKLITYQSSHLEIVEKVKELLANIQGTGTSVSLVTAHGVMLATILTRAPEIFDKIFCDGSTFRASNTFMQHWLHEKMSWSWRKATRAAQKKPLNWKDQCEKSQKAYLIKEEDIQAALYVNANQTQVVYAPGDKMTWAETGSKQVALIGGEEKHAFTILVAIACDGTVLRLPMQAIYLGKTQCSWPSKNSPHYNDLINAGFLLQESGTGTYWSNLKTMNDFVNNILVHISINLNLNSVSLWLVHQLKTFHNWMKQMHPNIILDFVPGGCMSVAQPCDVGIQWLFKLSIRRSYHEDVVFKVMRQLESQANVVDFDTHVGAMQD